MTLNEIKAQLGVEVLHLNIAKDMDGNSTEWYRFWDNATRKDVSIHEDLVSELKSNPHKSTLYLQDNGVKISAASDKKYHRYRIVSHHEPDVTL